jgi:hypothetical protein
MIAATKKNSLMSKEHQIEEQLWSYIDGSATPAQVKFIEQKLASDEQWKAKYKEQLDFNQLLLNETELDQPSLRFTRNVMDGIAGMQPKAATSTYINKNIIRSIAAFFILSISGLLIYSFSQVDWVSSAGSTQLIPFETKSIDLTKFDYSKIFNSTTIYSLLMVTVLLTLMLFDGFLRRKKSAA